ncbi:MULTISPECIES: transporter [Haloprofundus]|uniref:transporter n=1 Tax=Haloprofundus TaxID=1911573 RepID=UPI000E42D318|nr:MULTISPECIES: transporter [Haloprofundus]QCJ46380.1 transporter [Haloprofundus sp. MHR1]
MTETNSGRFGALAAAGGALVGGIAYAFGYAMTYVVASSEIQNSGAQQLLEVLTGESATWKAVGWVFYNAHFVDTDIPGLFGASRAVNFVAEVEAFPTMLYVLPPVLLLLAGAAVARTAGVTDPTGGAKAGAAVLLGYFALSVAGAFAFAVPVGQTATAEPDFVAAVLVAGVVYPAVFGTLGGVVAGTVQSSRATISPQ